MDTAPKTFRAVLDLLKPTADGKIRGACHSGILRFFPAAKTQEESPSFSEEKEAKRL